MNSAKVCAGCYTDSILSNRCAAAVRAVRLSVNSRRFAWNNRTNVFRSWNIRVVWRRPGIVNEHILARAIGHFPNLSPNALRFHVPTDGLCFNFCALFPIVRDARFVCLLAEQRNQQPDSIWLGRAKLAKLVVTETGIFTPCVNIAGVFWTAGGRCKKCRIGPELFALKPLDQIINKRFAFLVTLATKRQRLLDLICRKFDNLRSVGKQEQAHL